ncbi:MAG: NTP transferase domain-containing protein [Clostridia bacterium]|nr:NTP transferase domain-containing protein [Clostridia bacterium]
MKLAIQAIIMAGGEGVRLRPLTLQMPKPLVPLLGEPVMGYALKLLKMHHFTEVAATLCYQPGKIRAAFGKGKDYGVKLHYYEERSPLGTAGSIRMVKDQIRDTFLVLSGDGLTDCDLTRAMAFHKEKKALATLVLKRVSIPLPYGVVLTDGDGHITRFIEKPTWSRVFSDLVNTGIYILEPEIFDYIPDTGTPDFGKDIFPALQAGGLPIYGFETTGYWCDVGDQKAYLAAQQAMLRGEVALPHASGVDENAQMDASAHLEGECLIGKGAVIGSGARIINSIIGENCVIGPGAVIENSCLWPRAAVQEKARIRGSVLCTGAVVRKEAEIQDGCALGMGAVAGANAQLCPGVKIWPRLKVASGAVAHRTLSSEDLSAPHWTHRGADCDTAEAACTLCAAYAKVTGARQVMVGGDGAGALQMLAAGSLAAAGIRVLQAGEMTETMLRVLVTALRLGGGVFVSGQLLHFLDDQGQPISARQMAAMDSCILRQDAPPAFSRPGQVIRFTGGEEIYLSRILPGENARPLWSPVAVFCDSARLRRMVLEGASRLGMKDIRCAPLGDMTLRNQETGFLLSETGEDVTVFLEDGPIPQEQKMLLLLSLCQKKHGALYDFSGVPRAAGRLSPLMPADSGEKCNWQRMITGDGLAAFFMISDALKRGPLPSLLEGLPETHIMMQDVPCRTRDKGRILHTICDHTDLPHTLGEGIRIEHEKGYATIVPDAHQGLVRITSESADSEFARELCDFYLDQIRGITGEKNPLQQ